jgi:GMP synthase (glutamine-hydrolysing)
LLLVIDNGSSYTKNLVNFLSEKKIKFESQKFDEVNLSDIQQFNSFIISGRRKNDRKINTVNSKIIKHAISEKKHLFGICYGAEILTQTLGGTIKKSGKQVKGEETVIIEKKNKICQNKINVFESHRYEISKLGNQLHCLASSKSCKYEVIKHDELDIFGTQFHPEMSSDGQSMIQAFLSI